MKLFVTNSLMEVKKNDQKPHTRVQFVKHTFINTHKKVVGREEEGGDKGTALFPVCICINLFLHFVVEVVVIQK